MTGASCHVRLEDTERVCTDRASRSKAAWKQDEAHLHFNRDQRGGASALGVYGGEVLSAFEVSKLLEPLRPDREDLCTEPLSLLRRRDMVEHGHQGARTQKHGRTIKVATQVGQAPL